MKLSMLLSMAITLPVLHSVSAAPISAVGSIAGAPNLVSRGIGRDPNHIEPVPADLESRRIGRHPSHVDPVREAPVTDGASDLISCGFGRHSSHIDSVAETVINAIVTDVTCN